MRKYPAISLLVRAGYIRQLASGIFTSMPLAKRSLTKIENIMRDEINAIGGQEMAMPVVHPAEIWKKTGRWAKVGPEMGRFKDRNGRDMVLAMTHEEDGSRCDQGRNPVLPAAADAHLSYPDQVAG